jgi:hypothetical protein
MANTVLVPDFLPLVCAAGFGTLTFWALPLAVGIDAERVWTLLDIFLRSLLIFASSFWIFIDPPIRTGFITYLGVYNRLKLLPLKSRKWGYETSYSKFGQQISATYSCAQS